MTAFLFYLLKVMLCSGVLFLYYHLALRNKAFHQWNRFYLLATVVLSLLLPLCRFTFLHTDTDPNDALALLRSLQRADETLEEFVLVSNNGLSQEQWFYVGYGLVCSVLLFSFLFSLFRIIRLVRTHTCRTLNLITLVDTDVAGTPFSFFHFVFWNRKLSLDTETGRQVFQHELVHVQEKHTLDKLLLQLTLIFFWCNPFFWLIRNEVRNIHEFIADKKAVGEENAGALAALLLQTAYPTQYAAFTNAFFQSSIKRRLMMLSKKQSLTYASRLLALPVIALLSFAFTVRTKTPAANPEAVASLPVVMNAMDTLPKKEIQSISVDKKSKDHTITLTFKDGSSKTYTEAEAKKEGLINDKKAASANSLVTKTPEQNPLYIVDGKEFNGDLNTIEGSSIESMNVLKNKFATDKYGEKGKNGVIEIILKKEKAPSEQKKENNIVFDQAETPASIDKQTWQAFLEKNLQPLIVQAASAGVKPGTYTVNMRFLVKTDGSVSEFTPLNDPGYDLAKKMVALMPNSPKWKPAEQNGQTVNSYHTQPITFVIQGQ